MKWTEVPPREPGWYWWHEVPDLDAKIVWVGTSDRIGPIVFDFGAQSGNRMHTVEDFGGRWCGPIRAPEDNP